MICLQFLKNLLQCCNAVSTTFFMTIYLCYQKIERPVLVPDSSQKALGLCMIWDEVSFGSGFLGPGQGWAKDRAMVLLDLPSRPITISETYFLHHLIILFHLIFPIYLIRTKKLDGRRWQQKRDYSFIILHLNGELLMH